MLNAQQAKAVEYDGGNLLITAGPGAGKTRTLTVRVARLAKTLSAGRKILVITFTNKAAGELQERLSVLGDDCLERVETGTFHAFALSLLRRYAARLKFPLNFQIATPDEVEAMAEVFWPQRSSQERRDLLLKVSRWKGSLEAVSYDQDIVGFRQLMRERERVDFDDILRDAVFLLKDEPDIRQQVQALYPYVCVDEYQDVSLVQEELLRQLAGEDVRFTVIGDPDQAIYGFRGADVSLFERFPQIFAPCAVMKLGVNYRSAPKIVKAAMEVIRHGARSSHAVDAEAVSERAGEVVVFQASSDKMEARYVARAIKNLTGAGSLSEASSRKGGYSFADIVILYRLNVQADRLAQALREEALPYRIYGPKAEPGGLEDVYEPRAEKISLMTLHAAKGLEYPVVFMTGCENGLLPLEMSFMPSPQMEERRLFYVGMTRAKERLVMTHAKSRFLWGETCRLTPSCFLLNISDELKVRDELPPEPNRKIEARAQIKLF